MPYTSASWNGQTINVETIRTRLMAGTLKQAVGRTLVMVPIVGRNVQDTVIDVNFVFVGTASTIDTARSTLITSNDVANHTWNDGVNNTTFVMVPETLVFDEIGSTPNALRGSFTLVQYQQ